jgi:hypothetical protein
VRVHSFTLSGLFALPGACDVATRSTSRPVTLQPPCLGRKPKARVATPGHFQRHPLGWRMDREEGNRTNWPAKMGLSSRGSNPKHRQHVRVQKYLTHGPHPSHEFPRHHHPRGRVRTSKGTCLGQPPHDPQACQGYPPPR